MKIKPYSEDQNWPMKLAFEQAEKAFSDGEVPVGAVVVGADGKILSKSRNTKENELNPCGHAEVNALIEASKSLLSWRLGGCSIYVTLEPCVMCLGAMIQARIKNLYFGTYDPKGGALSLGYYFYKDGKHNHRFNVSGGIMHYECSKILSTFFRQRRAGYLKPQI